MAISTSEFRSELLVGLGATGRKVSLDVPKTHSDPVIAASLIRHGIATRDEDTLVLTPIVTPLAEALCTALAGGRVTVSVNCRGDQGLYEQYSTQAEVSWWSEKVFSLPEPLPDQREAVAEVMEGLWHALSGGRVSVDVTDNVDVPLYESFQGRIRRRLLELFKGLDIGPGGDDLVYVLWP